MDSYRLEGVWHALEGYRYLGPKSGSNAYLIPLPPEPASHDGCQQFDFFTWFLLDNFEEIQALTDSNPRRELHPERKVGPNVQPVDFGQSVESSKGNSSCLVYADAFRQVLKMYQERWDQDKLLMNVDWLCLNLWPKTGIEKGWKNYKAQAAEYEKIPSNRYKPLKYSVSVEVAYEPITWDPIKAQDQLMNKLPTSDSLRPNNI